MPIQNIEPEAGSDDYSGTANGPGKGTMRPGWIVAVALYLLFISVLVLYGLLKLWPHPTPSGEAKVQSQASPSPQPEGSPTATRTPTPEVRAVTTPNQQGSQVGAVAPTTPTLTPTPGQTTTASSTPSPTPNGKKELPDPELISFFGGYIKANIYLETRLLLLVMLAGSLGSLMHSLRSLYWYTGNRMMVWSWLAFYLLLPFTGAILAVIFYFVVRGGFFSPQASFENTSPFGFAALSALVGLFSPQATLKLKEIAETIFTKPGSGEDSKTQASGGTAATSAPTVNAIAPASGSVAGGSKVTISGTGFANGVVVKFGGQPAVTSSTSTTIEVVTPARASGPAVVDVEVTNPDGQKATLSQGYTYLEGNGDAGAESADVETIDGCDVDIVDETPDEDLPITEGGVD